MCHDTAWPFLEPVDPVEVRDFNMCACLDVCMSSGMSVCMSVFVNVLR